MLINLSAEEFASLYAWHNWKVDTPLLLNTGPDLSQQCIMLARFIAVLDGLEQGQGIHLEDQFLHVIRPSLLQTQKHRPLFGLKGSAATDIGCKYMNLPPTPITNDPTCSSSPGLFLLAPSVFKLSQSSCGLVHPPNVVLSPVEHESSENTPSFEYLPHVVYLCLQISIPKRPFKNSVKSRYYYVSR